MEKISGPSFRKTLAAWFTRPLNEIAIAGKDFKNKRQEFNQHYLPNAIFLGGATEGKLALLENKLLPEKTLIYVCRNKTCKLPLTEVMEAIKHIAK